MTIKTLTLDHVDSPELEPDGLCNTFGIFTQEEDRNIGKCWYLIDESRHDGLVIWLRGQDYPRPKPGDIVRIHRLKKDKDSKMLVVPIGRNVVVWSAFSDDPVAQTSAREPTINQSDIDRRRALESFYFSRISLIKEIKTNTKDRPGFYDVAGQVSSTTNDSWGNFTVHFRDSSDNFNLRVFRKQAPEEVDVHSEAAKNLKPGDLFIAHNIKYNPGGHTFDLSANLLRGKSIRVVSPTSIFGIKLTDSLSDRNNNLCNSPNGQDKDLSQRAASNSPLRRSARLMAQTASPRTSTDRISPLRPERGITPLLDESVDEHYRDVIKLGHIEKKPSGRFDFYNFAGQVRGTPNETVWKDIRTGTDHKRWVFLLYDGSKLDYTGYHIKEKTEPHPPNCATVYVYGADNRPEDTDKHIQDIQKVKDGDLVYLKNIKASWPNFSQLKLELSANTRHGKGIEVISKTSQFGIHLMKTITTPDVEELASEYSDDRSQGETSFDCSSG